MHSPISLFLAASSLYVANVIAAPAGLSPRPQEVSPSTSTTPTASDIHPATMTPAPRQKRQTLGGLRNPGNINMLEDFVLPQAISPSSPTTTTSSTFAFVITRPTPPAGAPVRLGEREVVKAMTNEDKTFGPLADLSFPQMIVSSSAVPTPTPAAGLSPERHPLARIPVAP